MLLAKISNYLFSAPLPFITLFIPFLSAILIFMQRLYKRMFKNENRLISIEKKEGKIIKITLFSIFFLNFILTLLILFHVRIEGTSFHILSSNGWVRTLSGENHSIHALIHVDILGAFSAAVMAFISLGSILTTIINDERQVSPTKAAFSLLTLCGVQGVFYSDGLLALTFFLFITQVGITGLYIPIPSTSREVIDSVWYYLSRLMILFMFFAGALYFYITFKTDNITMLSSLIKGSRSELSVFILLIVPMFFLFIKHFPYVGDASSRTFFRMMSQASFFVIIRIVFFLYGPMPGLDKVPILFVFLGLIDLFLVLFIAKNQNDPAKFTEGMEQYLKTLMLISLGLAMEGTSSATLLARFGFVAIESMLSMWILYLPFSVTLSIVCVNLKKKYDDLELWEYGNLYNKVPFTTIALFLCVCVMVGLPPFAGFVTKQFLYRATFNYNAAIFVLLFASTLLMLLFSLRFFVFVFFKERHVINRGIHKTGIALKIYLVMIFILFSLATFFPGVFFNKYLSPSVDSLLANKGVFNTLNKEIADYD